MQNTAAPTAKQISGGPKPNPAITLVLSLGIDSCDLPSTCLVSPKTIEKLSSAVSQNATLLGEQYKSLLTGLTHKLGNVAFQFFERGGLDVHHVARVAVVHGHPIAEGRVSAQVIDGMLRGELRSGEIVTAVGDENTQKAVFRHGVPQLGRDVQIAVIRAAVVPGLRAPSQNLVRQIAFVFQVGGDIGVPCFREWALHGGIARIEIGPLRDTSSASRLTRRLS
jgi:hypothetical protein